MASIFTKIINGEIPCFKVCETEKFIAFLDINPVQKGHTLCVPKQEISYIFDLDDQLLGELMIFSKKVAKAIEKVIDCERIGVSVMGLEVPHTHIHLVPMKTLGDMDFAHKKTFPNDQMQTLAEEISKHIEL